MINNLNNFKHFVSLGYFCDIASDLEKLGLRDASYPFDWLLTPETKSVINEINNNFSTFLDKDSLYQLKDYPNRYRNILNNIDFYHDFNAYTSLEDDFNKVKSKYDRRIKRFYKNISEPTLFIRYVNTEKDSSDSKWVIENYDYISKAIKSFNENNEIIFLCIKKLNIPNSYLLKEDDNGVCHNPIFNSSELYTLFSNVNFSNKAENINRHSIKEKRKNNVLTKISNKIIETTNKKYIHSKII